MAAQFTRMFVRNNQQARLLKRLLSLSLSAGAVLYVLAALQMIPAIRWRGGIFLYFSSPQSNVRQRGLVEEVVATPYQGTEVPNEQSNAPTPSLAPIGLSNQPSQPTELRPSTSPTTSSAPSLSHPPSTIPSVYPSDSPSAVPSHLPTLQPTLTIQPSTSPSIFPSISPSLSLVPSTAPSASYQPTTTAYPTDFDADRTEWPSVAPTTIASEVPSPYPSSSPSELPSSMPSLQSDLFAEHFLTIVLQGALQDFRPPRWQLETSNFIQRFWDDTETNPFSPVFVGHVETRYIKQTRIGEIAPGADNTSLPLAIDYQQLINYTMLVNEYDAKLWGDLQDTLFTYPFELNALGYMTLMTGISDNPSAIFLSSYAITTPEEEIGSSGSDAAIISILVVGVALVLLAAAFYFMHLLRKDRAAQEKLIQAEQDVAEMVEDVEDKPVSQQEVVESPPPNARFQDSPALMSTAPPSDRRLNSFDSGSDRDENSNDQHRRYRSNSNIDDRSNYMSDLEGMVIDSLSVGDDNEEDATAPILSQTVDDGYPDGQYGSRDDYDESDDDYDEAFHMRQTGFIISVEDIDD
ncbi:hypothetical protein FisN_25Lh137 [Fistulifera solaris]|uniref:Uncharacterized protein n=1 Tax=Fistulifera solaris TaxID=1519565 RepID=A0A1Z5J7U9_FISSO|nr:hypothetical protein FisN_25Lh137 [Fistulifera solaris]|eukprot:GAX10016.1 hypothetical protein FisN_25Lh137 [Fistulifera solaris]